MTDTRVSGVLMVGSAPYASAEETFRAAMKHLSGYLARLPDGRPVAVQQGPHLATAFHPELTADRRLHRHFLATVAERSTVRAARVATDRSAFPG